MNSLLHPSALNVDMSHIPLHGYPTSCEPSLSELDDALEKCVVQPDPQSWGPTHEGNCFVREAIVERAHCAQCAAGAHTYKIGYAMWKRPAEVWTCMFHHEEIPEGGGATLRVATMTVAAKLISVEKLES